MKKVIRIGTRESQLALWQALTVQDELQKIGYQTEIVPITSEGDLVLDVPLYEMGITGIFTKTLDVALLTDKIDIAVHSLKDVPTRLPKGLAQGAVLKRADCADILVYKNQLDFLESKAGHPACIATGSLRRKAQWLHRFPNHQVVNLRGNVNTRLKKLEENNWNGAVFAKAGLERLNLIPEKHLVLDWMIPAPAQGAVMIMAKTSDEFSLEALSQINDANTEICTRIERMFLQTLEGGCTAPIGAFAEIKDDKVYFTAAVFDIEGKEKIDITQNASLLKAQNLGTETANTILQKGGKELMEKIKRSLQKNE